MKKSNTLLITSLVTLALASASIAVVASKKNVVEAEGYSTSTLPTTIDLNDVSSSNVRSYYSSLNDLSQSERQGTNLLKNLKTILKNGQKYYSYDSGNAIWQIYEIADRDWDKSPASSTSYGTYNSSTNKITNYSYGTSSSSSKNNPYIHALYINRDVTNETTAWDDHQQTQWGINREHVWPKAEGFETSGAGGARGDPMHLMAGNGYANNIHSNNYYGYVNTSSTYTNCGSKYSNLSGNLSGKSKTLGGSTTVFEPQDCDKGDIARAVFYMVARYNYLSGSDSDGIDSNNPNLALTQSLSDWASSGYSSTTSTTGKMGIMTDLLNWNRIDPPDAWEIHRNNLLYKNYTNNRNPFVDYPEWAEYIWGKATYSGSTYQSYSSSPTGYATPSSDTLNDFSSGGSTTTVTLSLDKVSLSLTVGEGAGTITATASGSTGYASFVSSDTSVCTVSDSNNVATVSPVAAGTATITVTYGGETATCEVTVSSSGGSGGGSSGTFTVNLQDKSLADATSYQTNQTTSNYNGGGATASLAWGSINPSTGQLRGSKTTQDNLQSDENFWLHNTTPLPGKVTSITISGITGSGTWSFTSSKVFAATGSSAFSTQSSSSSTAGTAGTDSVSWTFNSASSGTYFAIGCEKGFTSGTVKATSFVIDFESDSGSDTPILSSISVDNPPDKTTYTAGEYFDPTGLVLELSYSDDTSDYVTYSNSNASDFTFTPSTSTALTTSHNSVSIGYGGKTCSQEISVSSGAATDTDVLFAKGFANNTNTGYTTAGTDYSALANSTDVSGCTYALQVFNGSNGQIKGSSSTAANETFNARNKQTFADHYISQVKLTVRSGTLSGANSSRSLVYFGSSAYANPYSTAPTGTATRSVETSAGQSSLTWTNSNTDYGYFVLYGLLTANSAYSDSADYALEITWRQKSAQPVVTGVTLSASTLNLDLNGTLSSTLTATVAGTNVTQSVSWSTSNTNVATVNGGLVTAVDIGTATITVTSTDDTSKSATCTVTVSNGATSSYSLTSGSPYINGVAYKMFHSKDSNTYYFNGSGTSYGSSSTNITYGRNVYFEANGNGQNIYMKSGSDKYYFYVYVSSGKYYFHCDSTTVPSTPWIYDSTNGCMTYSIDDVAYTYGAISSDTYTTFGAYTVSSTTYKFDFVTSDDTANTGTSAFATVFMSSITCDSSGNTGPQFSHSWSELSNAYNKLSANNKSAFVGASPIENSSSIIEQAAYRYDYIVGKYGTGTYNDFASRSPASIGITNSFLFANGSSDSLMAILVIVLMLGLTGVVAYVYIRRRETN